MEYNRINNQEELDVALVGVSQLAIEMDLLDGDISDLILVDEDGRIVLRVRPGDYQEIIVEMPAPVLMEPKIVTKWRLHGTIYPVSTGGIRIVEIFDKYPQATDRRIALTAAFKGGCSFLAVDAVKFDEQGNESESE